MKRRVPLKRKTPPRPKLEAVLDERGRFKNIRRKPMKRTRLKARSKKRAAQERQYNKRVKQWKLENPLCKACIFVRDAIDDLPIFRAPNKTIDCHHSKGRGPYYLDESTWVPVCRRCHRYIENNKKWAREKQFILYK